MTAFVKFFISEIERVENIYIKMHQQYKEEFDLLQDRYLKKQTTDHEEPDIE